MKTRPGLFALASFLPTALSRGILAIDYGAQYTQISLVQPGLPFDVLLNHDSKRKTQSVVSIRNDEKLVGDSAASIAGRYPQNSFPAIKLLLGQPLGSPSVQFHTQLYNIQITNTTRNTVQILPNLPPLKPSSSNNNNTTVPQPISYLPEELLALQFSYARELADQASFNNPNSGGGVGGERIVDAIITVPGFFNQFERKSILDAAELSGLKVLTLIDDGSSVAVNYAMMRSFPTKKSTDSKDKEIHLIYDVGSSSIKSTIVEFSMFEEPIHPSSKTKKNVTYIDVKGYGFERNFGGFHFDLAIRDKLVNDFEVKEGINVRGNDRAMIKLLREAGKVKHVLSANNESQCRVEGLIDDKDFKSSITRQEFEAMFVSQQQTFTQPILDSLSNAQLTLADIKSVILVGGSTRVPMIQTALKSLVGEDKIAVNVNADEAAVMGAALYGAGVSRQFKTKDIRIQSISPHIITASYKISEDKKNVTSTVFGLKSKLGGKKVLKIKADHDLSILFGYGNQPDYFPSEVLNVTIHGISAAISNHTNVTGIINTNKNSTTVSVSVKLDDLGLLVINEASLLISGGQISGGTGSLAGKIAGFFGSGGSKSGDKEEESVVLTMEEDGKKKEKVEDVKKEEKSELEKAKDALKAENEKASGDEKKVDSSQQQQVIEDVVVKVQITRQPLGILPMTTQDRITSGKLIRELKAAEMRKKNKEEARNALEAYTYKLRDRLDQNVLVEFGTVEELDGLKLAREEVSDWLNDWGEEAPIKELKSKKNDLEAKEKKIADRVTEAEKRPEAYKSFQQTLSTSQTILTLITDQIKSGGDKNPLEYTNEDTAGLSKLITEQTAWFNDIKNQQDKLEKNVESVVKVSDLEARRKVLDGEVRKLSGKKAPKKKKKDSYSTKPVAKAQEEKQEEKKKETDEQQQQEGGKKEGVKDEL